MKTKMVKKLFAVVLSAAMVMGMSATVMAADTTTGEAPIYSFDVENVIVPTTFVTAFNPDGLIVKKSDGTTSTAPIQSMNYGILNKSSTTLQLIQMKALLLNPSFQCFHK